MMPLSSSLHAARTPSAYSRSPTLANPPTLLSPHGPPYTGVSFHGNDGGNSSPQSSVYLPNPSPLSKTPSSGSRNLPYARPASSEIRAFSQSSASTSSARGRVESVISSSSTTTTTTSYLPPSPPEVKQSTSKDQSALPQSNGVSSPTPSQPIPPPLSPPSPHFMNVNVSQDAPTFLALAFMEIYYSTSYPTSDTLMSNTTSCSTTIMSSSSKLASNASVPFWHPSSPLYERWRILHPWCRHIISCCPSTFMSLHVLELALLYVRKFKAKSSLQSPAFSSLCAENTHTGVGVKTDVLLLVTCLILALKAMHDTRSRALQNIFWANACGFPLSILNRVERSFLRMCRWEMWIRPTEYAEFRGYLASFYSD